MNYKEALKDIQVANDQMMATNKRKADGAAREAKQFDEEFEARRKLIATRVSNLPAIKAK